MGTEIEDVCTKAKFAARCGVSSAAITKAVKGPLGDALVYKKIDTNHPAAKKYAEGRTPKEPKATKVPSNDPAKKTGRAAAIDQREQKHIIEGYYQKTLLEIVEIHGSQAGFEGWLRTAKLLEEVRERRTKNFEREGALVPRDLVLSAVIVPYDAAHKALLNNVSKTLAARCHSMAKAGSTPAQLEKFVVKTISKTLQRATVNVKKALQKEGR